MTKDNVVSLSGPAEDIPSVRSVLDELVQEGARKMLQTALENEVRLYIERHRGLVDEQGRPSVIG